MYYLLFTIYIYLLENFGFDTAENEHGYGYRMSTLSVLVFLIFSPIYLFSSGIIPFKKDESSTLRHLLGRAVPSALRQTPAAASQFG